VSLATLPARQHGCSSDRPFRDEVMRRARQARDPLRNSRVPTATSPPPALRLPTARRRLPVLGGAPVSELTWSVPTRLTPSQEFRIRVARNDLKRARELGESGAAPAELELMMGALVSSLYNALQIVEDLAESGW